MIKLFFNTCYLLVYQYSPFRIVSIVYEEVTPIYEGFFIVGGYNKGYFSQYGWLHNLRIGPHPAKMTSQFVTVICNFTFFLFFYCNWTAAMCIEARCMA
jgi:hypothetical protein